MPNTTLPIAEQVSKIILPRKTKTEILSKFPAIYFI